MENQKLVYMYITCICLQVPWFEHAWSEHGVKHIQCFLQIAQDRFVKENGIWSKYKWLITSYKYLQDLKLPLKTSGAPRCLNQFLNPVNTTTTAQWINYTSKSKKDNCKRHSKLTKQKWTRKYLCTYWPMTSDSPQGITWAHTVPGFRDGRDRITEDFSSTVHEGI